MLWKYLPVLLVLIIGAVPLPARASQVPVMEEWPASALGESQSSDNHGLTLGMRISSEFDDNALSDNHHKQPNVMAVFEPHVRWKGSHPRMEWFINYSNGFSESRPVQGYDSQSHLLDAELRLRPSKHFMLVLNNNLFVTKNPFDVFPVLSTSSVTPAQLGNSLLAANSSRISEQVDGELMYELSRHDTIGAGGTFLSVHYTAIDGVQTLPFPSNVNSSTGRFFYTHHLSRRHWIGVDYEVQKTNSLNSSALVHSAFYKHKIQISSKHVFSLFAGPQIPGLVNSLPGSSPVVGLIVPPSPRFQWAYGANYAWTGAATQVSAGFYRKIGSGIELPEEALITSANANVSRKITQRWAINLAAGYDYNRSLDSTGDILSFAWAAGGVSRALSRVARFDVSYWRVHQSGSSFLSENSAVDHDRLSVSVQYEFKAPGVR